MYRCMGVECVPPSLHPPPSPTGKAIASIILSLSFPGPHTTAAVRVVKEEEEEGRGVEQGTGADRILVEVWPQFGGGAIVSYPSFHTK